MKNRTDAELMQLVQQGHRPALEELYDRYVKLVYSFAIKALKDEQQARSIVQAVFMRLWTTETGYDPARGSFVNWLITVTRNIIIDQKRKEKREQVVYADSSARLEQVPAPSHRNPEEIVSQKLLREEIRKGYQYLTPHQIELIHSLYWEGYSLREIAAMRDEPIGTVKSRLHQALKVLRKHLVPDREG